MTPFGLQLRMMRRERKMTMAYMAGVIGVTPAYLSQLETGKKGQPSTVMVDRICGMLGLIWDDAESLKDLAKLSRVRTVIDTSGLGPEATRAANLMSEILPRVDEEESKLMADWLDKRRRSL